MRSKTIKLNLWSNSGVNYSPELIQYNSDVIANGGSLSSNDKTYVNTFISTLKNSGVWSKITEIGLFMGGFNGMITKLKYANVSIKNLVSNNFVSGDYSESGGLLSTNTTKYIDTQMVPNVYGMNKNNFSFGLMILQDNEQFSQYWAGDNAATSHVQLIKNQVHLNNDAGANVANISVIEKNVVNPHWLSISLGTNMIVLDDYQKNVIDGSFPVGATAITLSSNILLFRANGSTFGKGALGGYYTGGNLTYSEMLTVHKAFKQLNISKGRITVPSKTVITFGDSITAGGGASQFFNRYSYLLATALGYREACMGIGSSKFQTDTTIPSGFGRYTDILNYDLANSKIVIQYGVNDYQDDVSGYGAKLVTMLNALLAAGATDIQVGSPSPVNNGTPVINQTNLRDIIATAVITVGSGYVVYKNVYDYMMANGGYTLLSGDNLHPNDSGHSAISFVHSH